MLPVSAGQATGSVLRGGSFNNNMNNAACAYRNNNNPNNDNNNYGVRLVVSPITCIHPGGCLRRKHLLPKMVGVHGFQLEAGIAG